MANLKEIFVLNNDYNNDFYIEFDSFIKIIGDNFKISLIFFNNVLSINPDNLDDNEFELLKIKLQSVIKAFILLYDNNISLSLSDKYTLINNIDENNYDSVLSLFMNKEVLYYTIEGKKIYPKTLNQKLYIKELYDNDIVFALGPAGTGKTYLGVMFACKLLKSGSAKKIVLVRPVVEAGEKLGFLPGDLKEKIDPYLIPIYDTLYEALGKEQVTKYIEKGIIEVAPLAYMRGRTLDNSCIILDEAQNATVSQMKMFLTRLGFNSKMIITGDVTQIDLPHNTLSGLINATTILKNIEGLKIINFQKDDVMRHPLVFKIIERYENR